MKRHFVISGLLLVGLLLFLAGCNANPTGKAWTLRQGVCIIRSGSSSMPQFSAANVGNGYAKTNTFIATSFASAQAQCTSQVYATLKSQYCGFSGNAQQGNVQLGVAWVNSAYGPTSACAAANVGGCNPVNPGCPAPVIPTCTDTDGGYNKNVKGTCTGSDHVAHTDDCWSSGGMQGVSEWMCQTSTGPCVVDRSYPQSYCPYGCVNGACRPGNNSSNSTR